MIAENMRAIIQIDDYVWGQYAFSRDPIRRKISIDKKEELIKKAISCGHEEAMKIKKAYGKNAVSEYCKDAGIQIILKESEGSDGYIVFAQYNSPNKVTLYQKNIERVNTWIKDNHLSSLLERIDVKQLLIAHEIFHHLEYIHPDIITQTEKIELWRLGPFKNESKAIAVSEIAAMSFARTLMDISYNPYVFDVVMLYPHNDEKVQTLIADIMEINKQCKEKNG